MSARLSREHGVKAVPVFWIDAEDHDWDEIAGCGVLAADQTLRRVQVRAPEGAGERTVASLRYTDAIVGALEELAATLPATEFTGELLDALRDAYQPGRGVAEAFGRFIDRVLGPHGLVVYDASDPAAKPFAAPVFLRELERRGPDDEPGGGGRRRPGRSRLPHAGDAARVFGGAVRPRRAAAAPSASPATGSSSATSR